MKPAFLVIAFLAVIPATYAGHLQTQCPFTLHDCPSECRSQSTFKEITACFSGCFEAIRTATEKHRTCLKKVLSSDQLYAKEYENTISCLPSPPPPMPPPPCFPGEDCRKIEQEHLQGVWQDYVNQYEMEICLPKGLQKAAEEVETGRTRAAPETPVQPTSGRLPRLPEKAIPAEQRVPVTKEVEVQGTAEVQNPDGSWKPFVANSQIKLGDRIRTSENGRLRITLLDDTAMTLGPNSDVTIDETIFDPDDPKGMFAAEVLKGVFRYVTGKVARREPFRAEFRLPTIGVGIRGTDFIAAYDDKTNIATISVNEGIVTYTPFATNETLEIPSGQTAMIQESGAATTAALFPSQWEALIKEITPVQRPSLQKSLLALAVIAFIIWSFITAVRSMRKKAGSQK